MTDITVSWYHPKVNKNGNSVPGSRYVFKIIGLLEFICNLTEHISKFFPYLFLFKSVP